MNKPLILIVEDDLPIRNLITTTLKTNDYRYLVAVNGEAAILEASSFVNIIPVVSAQDMFEAVKEHYEDADFIIKSAAVADYTPAETAEDKIKKKEKDMSISLKPTVDILKYIGENRKPHQVVCGFAMETKDLVENAVKKLESKHVDMIIANNLKVKGAGFGTDTNVVTIIKKDEIKELPMLSKEEVAKAVLDEMLTVEK